MLKRQDFQYMKIVFLRVAAIIDSALRITFEPACETGNF